jgi:GNAT superfamily N-acetyltransferase
MELQLRSATPEDVIVVQTLRKTGWQDNYANPESGVTAEILRTELAPLPPPQKDIDYYIDNIAKPENSQGNIVAIADGRVVGTVFYATLENGNGDIGVFVDREHRGQGVGSALLEELIKRTDNTLEVTIFAKNRSRKLYNNFGFVEAGEEGVHEFKNRTWLPIQRLVLER